MKNIGKIIGITILTLAIAGGLGVGGYYTYKNWDTIASWFSGQKSEEPDNPVAEVEYLKYQISKGVILKYTGEDSKITIPTTYDVMLEEDQIKYIVGEKYQVTSIGSSAFSGNKTLTSVIINTNIKSIGSAAFSACSNLEEIILPDTITKLNNNTFSGCAKLTKLTIPTSVTSIGDSVFVNSGINNINFPSSVKSIGSYNFRFTRSLAAVTFAEGLESIGKYNFDGTSIETLSLPNSLKTISDSAFQGMKSLRQVTMGSGIESLPSQVFTQCIALTEFIIPDSVKSIAVNAFSQCSALTKVYIPATVETIEVNLNSQGPFYDCGNVLKLYCEAVEKPEGWDEGFNNSNYLDENHFSHNCVLEIIYGATIEQYEAA